MEGRDLTLDRYINIHMLTRVNIHKSILSS